MARRIDTEAEIDWIRLADQAGDPASPAAGYKYFYAKAGGLYAVNSAGTVVGPFVMTTLSSDPLWDAAGDIVYASGANAGAKLTIGTAYQVLSVNTAANAVEWANSVRSLGGSGTTFTISNTTTETDVWVGPTVEANSMGSHGQIRIKMLFDLNHAVVCTTTFRVYLGLTVVASFTEAQGATDPNKKNLIDISVSNTGATGAQYYQYMGWYSDGTYKNKNGEGTAAADTTADNVLKVTAQHSVANAGNTYTHKHICAQLVMNG